MQPPLLQYLIMSLLSGKVQCHITRKTGWGESVVIALKRGAKDAIIFAGQEKTEKPAGTAGAKGRKT